jgi:CRP-like cAMP-binding protein
VVARTDGDVLAAAARNRLLNELPETNRAEILAHATVVKLEQGRELYREGGIVSMVYFPVDAVISMMLGEGNTDIEIATVGNEGLAGASATAGVPRALGKTLVQVPGHALTLNAVEAERLARELPNFALLMQRFMFAFLRLVAQGTLCCQLHSVEERCARWLLLCRDRAGSEEFRLTQDFLATMVGARRGAVNLALAVFRKAGAIEYSYRMLKMLSSDQLESFSCPCYRVIRETF